MGGAAAVCEMLLQSRRGELRLLPALPKAWSNGRVENFRAQDGVTVSCSWTEGKLESCTLLANEDISLRILSGELDMTVDLKARVPYDLLKGASNNSPHGESTESFPPELCSEIVTKILRRG